MSTKQLLAATGHLIGGPATLAMVPMSLRRARGVTRPTFPELSASASPWIEPGLPAGLARLSEKQRTVVWLVHGFEWTLGETASLLGISVQHSQCTTPSKLMASV